MKRYEDNFEYRNAKKHQTKKWRREHSAGGFRCSHCKQFVIINDTMGTVNRNHCNRCLWSKHVDEAKGDRRATCSGGMKPVGLTLKHEGYNRVGEIMVIHLCSVCQKISINRVARDDFERRVLEVLHLSFGLSNQIKQHFAMVGINLLEQADEEEVRTQLFGELFNGAPDTADATAFSWSSRYPKNKEKCP